MPTPFARLITRIGRARVRHLVIVCGFAAGLVLAVGTTLLLLAARQADLDRSARELKNLALVLADETDRSFQSMDLTLTTLIDHWRERHIDTPEQFETELATHDVWLELNRRIVNLPQITSLILLSRTGHMVNHSRLWPLVDIDNSGRDYFQAVTRDPSIGSYISAPLINHYNGAWTLALARAVMTRDGRMIGVICASVEINTLERMFSRLAVDPDASFNLVRSEGTSLAHYPHLETPLDLQYKTSANRVSARFRNVLGASDRGTVIQPSVLDGRLRMVAPRSVAHFPLIVSATDTVDAILAPWRARLRATGTVVVFAELILAGIVLLGVRHALAQEGLNAAHAAALQAEAARIRAESELALARQRADSERTALIQAQRFELAIDNMQQGVVMYDNAGRMLLANARYAALLGLPEDVVQAVTTYAEMVELALTRGEIAPEDMAVLRTWRQRVATSETRSELTWERSDDKTLLVTHLPMPDGWLTTYEDITNSRRLDLRMAYMARHDALTDLPNRVLFREKLEEALAHARRGRSLALLYLDLDQFKAVNDTLGHPVGDALLQAVAHRLTNSTRDTDTVARLGGDEFAIVQAPINQPGDAAAFAQRLIGLMETPFEISGQTIVIGTSVGIAIAPRDGLDPDQLLKSADMALYRAKLDGRGVYRLFEVEMDQRVQARRALEIDLRGALPGDQFEVVYQPLIDLRARAVSGFEALLRWHHPARGNVPPDAFIPLAEEVGLIVPIGVWVLRQSCAAAVAWPNGMRVSVNLSPAQFRCPGLVETVTDALRETGLSAERLELEITETVMLRDTEAVLATLHGLHDLGVHIAMDDFGTGYSSLSYLRQFPFDRVKIDQSFIRDLGTKRDSDVIVRTVTALTRELGMATTAEGVETREQLAILMLTGCSDAQGYLFSRPVSETAVAGLLRSMPSVDSLLAPVGADRLSAEGELEPVV
jgi:diguanylate cyclase (GGDEF)-like protein